MESNNKGLKFKPVNKRISFVTVVFSALLLFIMYKLFLIQIIDSPKYRLAARKQYESKITLKPSRGIIFDRKMNALVSNTTMYSCAADPNMIDNKDSVATVLSDIFNKDKNYYLDKLNSRGTSFVWLERRADSKYENILKDLNISGVIRLNEPNRVFNYEGVASQIIGFTSIDNEGLSGIELYLNDEISGKPGFVIMQKDGLGRKRPAVEYPRSEPVDGNNVVLTIDLDIQKIVEEELLRAVEVNNAEGGKIVVMNVRTGEILAMHSVALDGSSPDKIGVITDLYEPGSTFKIVTAAASIQEKIMNKEQVIYTYGGEYLKSSNSRGKRLSFRQIIEQSDNDGIKKIAHRLGKERFYKYARDFGYGIYTGIDLPGENKGRLKKPVEFSPVSIDFMSIGYEIMVTALQMTNAFACIANNGTLMKPFVIKKILSPDGRIIKHNKPVEIRKVVSPETARILTDLLVGVVERGTGKDAALENFRVAGKTGTSQKLVQGSYSKSKYTSSFIGYFPAESPQIVISVIIDSPGAGEYYGGKVSAPVFRRVAERIINLAEFHEYPEPESVTEAVYASDNHINTDYITEYINLINSDLEDAVNILEEKNIRYEISGEKENSYVSGQKVIKGSDGKTRIILLTEKIKNHHGSVKLPDLKGMSIRKCIKILSSMDIKFEITGSGKVTEQFPSAGAEVTQNQTVLIKCSNHK